MADCECLSTCPFFHDRMAEKPAMADRLKRRYCRDDSTTRARHQVFAEIGSENVPADLYPQETFKVEVILGRTKLNEQIPQHFRWVSEQPTMRGVEKSGCCWSRPGSVTTTAAQAEGHTRG